jgi:hypothetical protein
MDLFRNTVSIRDMRNQFPTSPLLSSKYKIIITPPSRYNELLATYKLAVLSKSFSLPRREVKTKKITFKGRPVNVRSQLEFSDTITVSVYDDSGMNLRRMLEKWMNGVDSIETSYRGLDYKDGDIKIYQLDANNNEIYGVQLHDVFITSLGEISYSADSHDIITYDLTFTYSGFDSIL